MGDLREIDDGVKAGTFSDYLDQSGQFYLCYTIRTYTLDAIK